MWEIDAIYVEIVDNANLHLPDYILMQSYAYNQYLSFVHEIDDAFSHFDEP